MFHLVDHSEDLWGGNDLAGLVDFPQTKSLKCSFLVDGVSDFTSDLFDSKFLFCPSFNLL